MSKLVSIHPVDPEAYPEYRKRPVKVVTRKDLDDRIHFTALRVFTIRDGMLQDYERDLELYVNTLKIGDIIWPFCSALYAKNFRDLVDAVKRRGAYLFDFWGYVPGSSPEKRFWGQYTPPKGAVEYARKTLGPRFLGLDNGEQDGRYIGGYAPLMCPAHQNGPRQYGNFFQFFEALGDDLHHHLSVLCSLNFCHYFAKEGDSIILGEESGQALPNINVWFSFLRGASKQYGILLFGNASIWNRWGYKSYESSGSEPGGEWGPSSGTSLSLLKRLLYTEYLYGCEILGFEQSWILNDNVEKRIKGEPVPFLDDPSKAELSPVGRLQVDAVRFVERHGRPGTLHTPVALLMHFFSGWTFPRHLYTDKVYQIWGNLPYREGDYQVDALFSMVYPGYENAGYFHDERGFVTRTPFGDSFDVLFSDARPEIIGGYSMVVAAGTILLDLEAATTLGAFAERGGKLVVAAAQLPLQPDARRELGILSVGSPVPCPSGTRTRCLGHRFIESAFEIMPVEAVGRPQVLATAEVGGVTRPLIVRIQKGSGSIDVICSPYGITGAPDAGQNGGMKIDNAPDREIPHPRALLSAVEMHLGHLFDEERLLDVGNRELQYSVSVKRVAGREADLVVSVSNNGETGQSFSLRPTSGRLASAEELRIEGPDRQTEGYYPPIPRKAGAPVQDSEGAYGIDAGEVRMFSLRLSEADVEAREKPVIRDRSSGMFLAVQSPRFIPAWPLESPTLLHHFEGLCVWAEYFLHTDREALEREARTMERAGCRLLVDFSSLLNFYPGLTLLDNIPERWQRSRRDIESVLDKASLFGCQNVVLSLHRNAENHVSNEEAEAMFLRNVGEVARMAAARGMTAHLQSNPWRRFRGTMRETAEFVRSVGAANLKPALNLCHCIASGEDVAPYLRDAQLVLVSAPTVDAYGQYADVHDPVARSPWIQTIQSAVRAARSRGLMICLDALHKSWDEVFRDLRAVEPVP